MSALIPRFQRDVTYFKQNLIPQNVNGIQIKELSYKAETHETLSDDDISILSDSLVMNEVFRGPLDLSSNPITDLAILNISRILSKKTFQNISELDLTNCKVSYNAGIYIGQALIDNPSYQISTILFKNINLEEYGLQRIIEASVLNKSIKKLHVGIITDVGLNILANELKNNDSLIKLEFQENPDLTWTFEPRNKFANTLREFTKLQMVKFDSAQPEEVLANFKHEIEYYTKKNLSRYKKEKKNKKKQQACNSEDMFESILQLVENKSKHKKMPVRKFFNNTFGTILNDAIFALKKKHRKDPDNQDLKTKKGMVCFVANYIFENLPDHEREPDLYDAQSEGDDN